MKKVRSKENIFMAFVKYLCAQNVSYVVVGDVSKYPGEISSDIDLIISTCIIAQCKTLVKKFADQENLQIVQIIKHEQSAFCFVLAWTDEYDKFESISLDICSDFFSDGRRHLTAAELLSGRSVEIVGDEIENGFHVPAPDAAFIYYLVKKIHKSSLDKRQFSYLQNKFLQCPEKCLIRLRQFWSESDASKMFNWIESGDLLALKLATPQLKFSYITKHSLKHTFLELMRKVYRVRKPTGLVVVLLGPDGCGKSTLAEKLQQELASVFRGMKYYHLRPQIFERKNSERRGVVDPYANDLRGVPASLAKLFFLLFQYTCGFWIKVFPLKVRTHFVLFDRYYHDILIDPRRYRYGAPMWIARIVAAFIPEPDLFIVLDSSADTVQSRKQEVSLEETRRQRDAYRAFYKAKSNCVTVNTDQQVSESVKEALTAIIGYMEHRHLFK